MKYLPNEIRKPFHRGTANFIGLSEKASGFTVFYYELSAMSYELMLLYSLSELSAMSHKLAPMVPYYERSATSYELAPVVPYRFKTCFLPIAERTIKPTPSSTMVADSGMRLAL
jgi:hypothetical protein